MSSYLEAEYAHRLETPFPTALMWYIQGLIPYPAKVFDVGAGTGDFGDVWPSAVKFLDTGPEGLREGRKDRFMKYDFENGPATAQREAADLVFSKSVIEHQRDPVKFLRGLGDLTNNNGYVVVMAPDWKTCKETFYDDPTHVTPITQEGLYLAAKMAGLHVLHMERVMQTPGLLGPGLQRKIGNLYGSLVSEPVALWLEKVTGNPWFRWAKQKAVLMIAMREPGHARI